MLHRQFLPFSVRLTLLIVLILALVSCGDEPPRPALRPTSAPPTPRLVVTPPGADVGGERLPGKLLFVRAGVVWLWEDTHAQALFGDGLTVQPTWSHDGSQIAYVQRGNSFSDLFIANADGALITQLTNNGGTPNATSFDRIHQTTWAFYPTWSLKDTTITYAGQASPPVGSPAEEFNLSLFQTGPQGGKQTQILADNEAHSGRSVYTADGTTLIYVRESSLTNGQQQLYSYTVGEANGRPVAAAPDGSYDPALSPDGAWLAFAVRSSGQTDVWALPVPSDASTSAIRLTSVGSARAPAFSPDGKLLAFLAIPPGKSGFELWVTDLQRDAAGALSVGQPRQITKDLHLDPDSGLSWR